MSSTTLEPTPAAARTPAPATAPVRQMSGTSTGPGPSFLRVLNSEFIKFRTLLSTLILLGSTVLVVVGFGALSAWGTGQFAEAAASRPGSGRRRSPPRAGTSPSASPPPASPSPS